MSRAIIYYAIDGEEFAEFLSEVDGERLISILLEADDVFIEGEGLSHSVEYDERGGFEV